jgi:alcohol dehydrogenase class IV
MKELILGGQALIIGRGSLEHLATLEARRVFIVTGGSSMLKSGVIARIEALMRQKSAVTTVYSGIPANPDTQVVLAGAAQLRDFAPDLVIAVGGGSALDAAKAVSLFGEYPGLDFAAALAGNLPVRRQALRLVAIPSTSGTGSEVTKTAVITFRDRDLKVGLKTPAFIPDIAILDADLTLTMPAAVVAETGLDALTHAVEGYTNPAIDDFTAPMAVGAVAGLCEYLPDSYAEGTVASREKVHHYQALAGLVLGNVGVGASHGISHAIGGKFGLGHGLINAIVLPHVIDFNSRDSRVKALYARLAAAIGAADFAAAVRSLSGRLGVPASLAAAGLEADLFAAALPQLVANSLLGSTRVNPVAFTAGEMEALLRRAWAGA